MPKLLSRSKHEEFKSKSALQIKDQRKDSRKQKKMEHYRNAFPTSTVHPASHCSSCCPFLLFTLCPVCICFWFFFQFTPVIAFRFWFFCNFPYTEHLYKPQYVQTQINQFGNRESGATVSPQLPFLHFLSFSLHFSAAKHSSEDENSEDGWLDLFLLEEEGYWAMIFKVNFWFPCFSRSRF